MKKRKGIIIALVCVIVLLMAGISVLLFCIQRDGKTEYEKQVELGRKYLSEDNYDKARVAFETAVKIEPKKADAYMGLSDAYMEYDGSGWREAALVLMEGYKETKEDMLINKTLEVGKSREDKGEKQEILDMVTDAYPNLSESVVSLYWSEDTEKPSDREEETIQTNDEKNSGNISGNINNGGFVAENDIYVVYSYQDALWCMKQDGTDKRMLYEGACSSLNLWEDKVYFLAENERDQEFYGRYTECTPYCVGLDGSGLTAIGPVKEEGRVSTHYSNITYSTDEYFKSAGYRGFIVYEGYIYYLSNNGRSGSYHCSSHYNGSQTQTASVTYTDNISIYRMDLDGSNVMELVGNIGNAVPQMCVSDDQLYYTISYYNCFFAPYNFTRLFRASLDGSGITELPASKDGLNAFNSDFGSYVEYVLGIQVSDGKLYMSCGDSEGEFPDSRFHIYNEASGSFGEPILSERSWVGTIVSDGEIYASTGGREWNGAGEPLTNRAMAICGQNGEILKLLKVFDEKTYGEEDYFNNLCYEINVSGEWVYYRLLDEYNENGKQEIGRISKDGMKQEILYGKP